jgi:hypothetical protein
MSQRLHPWLLPRNRGGVEQMHSSTTRDGVKIKRKKCTNSSSRKSLDQFQEMEFHSYTSTEKYTSLSYISTC